MRGTHLLAIAAAILAVNLPFGWWRAGVRKFSRDWFLAVHLPVPLAIAIRWLGHEGLHLTTLPIFVGAFFAGQFAGGRLRQRWRPSLRSP